MKAVHWRCCSFRNNLIFESYQLFQFRIFLKPVRYTRVPDEIVRSITGVHKMLTVVVVRIFGMCSLKESLGICVHLLFNFVIINV